MSRPIAILYEDERGEVRDFPLHRLVVNAVADCIREALPSFAEIAGKHAALLA